jgi:translation initiation factor 2 subunit 3
MEVEIRPGIIHRDPETGHCTCRPLRSKIVSLLAEQNQLQFAVPGGLIGVGTLVDPALCRADRLLGMVMSAVGKGPNIYTEIKAEGECLKTLGCRLLLSAQCSCFADFSVSRRMMPKRPRCPSSPWARLCS